jgi:opine dehydrogenase
MMKIAVLGGGHGCYAAAAEMAERGHEVWFWRRDASALRPLLEKPLLAITDFRGTREVAIQHVCVDLAESVAAAELIIVPLPATAQAELAKRLAPLLREGQVVFLPPGTFGSIIFASAMRECGNRAQACFAETGTLPNLVRKHGPAQIVISGYGKHLPTGVFPARLADHAFRLLQAAYPAIEPVEDVLSAALMNAGPIIHPPLILMNAGPLEHFPAWDIHSEGTQSAIRRVTDHLDAERIAVRVRLGYKAPHFPLKDHYASSGPEWMYGRTAHDSLTKSGDWREKIDLRTHRYMLEDTRLGLSLLASVAKWAGVSTPVASGLLALAGAVVGDDFTAGARTLASLGLADRTPEQMRALLREGF